MKFNLFCFSIQFAAAVAASITIFKSPENVSLALPILLSGVAFEAAYFAAQKDFGQWGFSLRLAMSSGLAAASIPLTVLLLLSSPQPSQLLGLALNTAITAFFVGIAGAVLALPAWYEIKASKPVIRHEYAV